MEEGNIVVLPTVEILPLELEEKIKAEESLKKIEFLDSNDTIDDNRDRNRRQLEISRITIEQIIDFLNLIILSSVSEELMFDETEYRTLVNDRIFNMTENVRNKFTVNYVSYMGSVFNEKLPEFGRIRNVNTPNLRSIYYSGSNNIKVLNKKTNQVLKFNDYVLKCIELQGIFPKNMEVEKFIEFFEIKPGNDYSITYKWYYHWEKKLPVLIKK